MDEDKPIQICKFYAAGNCRFGEECKNLHEGFVSQLSKKVIRHTAADKSKDTKKKPPMKTAFDVISRLKWDETYSKHNQDFVVGYVDRFVGVLERCFTEFNFEDDLASIDDLSGILAIPQHRIKYFKYRGVILWDKSCRLDFIFGSTGNKRVDLDHFKPSEDAQSDEGSTIDGFYSLVQSSSEEEEENNDEIDGMLRSAPARVFVKRATHFVAVKVTDAELIRNLRQLILELDKNVDQVRTYLYTPEMLHMTIITLRLLDHDDVNLALDVTKSVVKKHTDTLKLASKLAVSGVGEFHKKILHAKVTSSEDFKNFNKDLRENLKNSGIGVVSSSDDIPHITLAKVPQKSDKKCRMDEVLTDHLKDYRNYEFGSQAIDNVHVCLVGKPITEDGFYSHIYSEKIVF